MHLRRRTRKMPSKSKAQRNLMAAAAHNPKFAKKVGVPVKVAKEFNQADKGKKFKGGGMALFKGKETYGEELKEAKAVKSGRITPKQFAKGEKSEGHKTEEKGALKLGQKIKAGKVTPKQYAKKEAAEKYDGGGFIDSIKKGLETLSKADWKTTSDYEKEGGPKLPKKGKAISVTKETITATPDAIPSEIKDKLQDAKNQKGYENWEKSQGMKKGGKVKCMARGGGIEVRGKTRGRFV